jgi:hypothetical protein
MITIRLRGGLGNQMFQYAMGKYISKKMGVGMKLDLTKLLKNTKSKNYTARDYQLDIFNLNASFLFSTNSINFFYKYNLNFLLQIIKAFKHIGYRKYIEKSFTAENWIIENPKDKYLYIGYWQSEKYFKNIEDELRKDFQFKDELSEGAKVVQEEISKVNAVCVHVRRGDYVGNTLLNCSNLDYFINGSQHIFQNTNKPHFFVFSDDTDWCKQNIKFDYNYTIVDYKTNKIKYKEDLQLMASCNHFIMSASSFSWWAVWLSNKKEAVVVVPKNWFLNEEVDVSDLVDKKWVRL